MNKCAILIETIDEGKIAFIVPDYSKENVINAISKNNNIKADNIVQLAASMSYGIYAVKNKCNNSDIEPYKGYSDSEYHFIFRVDYIKVM